MAILLVSIAFLNVRCTSNENADISLGNIEKSNQVLDTIGTTLFKAPIGNSSYSLWNTCSTKPYLTETGICVPVGGQECSSNYLAAQQIEGQVCNGMQFYGCFKGGSNAPDGSNEEAVYVADDVVNWTGQEFGFVKTLNDNALKAYLQGRGVPTVFALISINDNGYHTFRALVNTSNHKQIDYYVDGIYKQSLTNSNIDYSSRLCYFVGTTHRTSDTWNSTGQQIEMYNMVTY